MTEQPEVEETERERVGRLLGEEFPAEMQRMNAEKGNITYIPIAEVVARLNRVLGVGLWSKRVMERWESGSVTTTKGTCPAWVMARVEVTCLIDGVPWVSEGVGGQAVKVRTSGSDVVDLGDEWKAAVSDALKKCVMDLGITLDLARREEAKAFDRRQANNLLTKDQFIEMTGALKRIESKDVDKFEEQKARLRETYGTVDLMTADDAGTEIRTLREIYSRMLAPPSADEGDQTPSTEAIPAPAKASKLILDALSMVEPSEAEMFEGWFAGHFERPFSGGDGLTIDEAEECMDYLGLTPEETRA